MIYENFSKAKTLVEQIEKLERLLLKLTDPSLVIKLETDIAYNFYTIGTGQNCEHSFARYATSFKDCLIVDTRCRIEAHKEELLTL
jgi:hypothetical protein